MKYKGSLGSRIFDVVNVVGLTLIMVVTLYPVIYVVLASVSDSNRLLAYTGLLVKPLGFNTAAYAAVIKNPNILSGYMVTIFVVVVGIHIKYFSNIGICVCTDEKAFSVSHSIYADGGIYHVLQWRYDSEIFIY